MKIFHIIDSGGVFGAEAMLLDLMTAQKAAGHSPVLCSIGVPDCGDKEVELRAMNLDLEVIQFRMKPGLNIVGGWNIVNTARQDNADIIHCHGYKADILLGLLSIFINFPPRVSTLHGWTNTRRFSKMACYEWLHAKSLLNSDGIVLVNNAMQKNKKIQNIISINKSFHVIKNGLDTGKENTAHYDAAIESRILEFKNKSHLIGTAGRLSREKGYDNLIKAFQLVKMQGHNCKLVIMGVGPLENSLKRTG